MGSRWLESPGIDVRNTWHSGTFRTNTNVLNIKMLVIKSYFFTVCGNLVSNVQCEVSELINLSPALDEQPRQPGCNKLSLQPEGHQ